jgi:hypothetical protein
VAVAIALVVAVARVLASTRAVACILAVVIALAAAFVLVLVLVSVVAAAFALSSHSERRVRALLGARAIKRGIPPCYVIAMSPFSCCFGLFLASALALK